LREHLDEAHDAAAFKTAHMRARQTPVRIDRKLVEQIQNRPDGTPDRLSNYHPGVPPHGTIRQDGSSLPPALGPFVFCGP